MKAGRVPLRYLWFLLFLPSLRCNKTTIDTNVAVRGVSLHIVCRGEGRPPVILEAGLGNDSSVWSSVTADVANTTQVCAYDRAGTGKSGAAPRPHSNQQMADELYDLLRAAKVPKPYVLVGHSMGGANTRFIAAKHPNDVAGMVLVDANSEHQPSRFWALLPNETLDEFRRGTANMPEGLDFDTFQNGLERLGKLNPSLGNIPLVVLTHGKSPPAPPRVSPALNEKLETTWHAMQEELAALSPNSAYLVVENAGHHIQLDRPDVVVAAINEVIGAVRERRQVRRDAISGGSE